MDHTIPAVIAQVWGLADRKAAALSYAAIPPATAEAFHTFVEENNATEGRTAVLFGSLLHAAHYAFDVLQPCSTWDPRRWIEICRVDYDTGEVEAFGKIVAENFWELDCDQLREAVSLAVFRERLEASRLQSAARAACARSSPAATQDSEHPATTP